MGMISNLRLESISFPALVEPRFFPQCHPPYLPVDTSSQIPHVVSGIPAPSGKFLVVEEKIGTNAGFNFGYFLVAFQIHLSPLHHSLA